MRLQLLSDLHLETEAFQPEPAPGAELLVLAGDIDSRWSGLAGFRDWPVPVLFVPGNHEYDGRDLDAARPQLREHCELLGLRMLDDQAWIATDAQGRRVRFLGSTRWSDFDAFGDAGRPKALRAAGYFQRVMAARWRGAAFDAEAVRSLALASRDWLAGELARPAQGAWDATVVITHFAPSLRSADPRYGRQPTTASFCNDDEALLPRAQLWLHGHVHHRHEYRLNGCRVLSNARGHSRRGEADGFDGLRVCEVFEVTRPG